MILILFTTSYPYKIALEHNFLDQEVKYLSGNFNRVIIVPELSNATRYYVNANVEIQNEYSITLSQARQSIARKIRAMPKIIFSDLFYREITVYPKIIIQQTSIRRFFLYMYIAEQTRKWICKFIEKERLDPNQCIFYTYWFDAPTLGIGLVKKNYPEICIVSRAHGYDLYAERHSPAYIPCRHQSLDDLDGLFPDSDAGTRYISYHYPEYAHLCKTSRLGVVDPGFITSPSKDGIFRIVSCSLLVPVKRVELLVKGIIYAARLRPELRIEWRHFGTGQLKPIIESFAQDNLPDNVNAFFPGYPLLENLLSFYKNNPIDVFMNVSESEGTPVSVMEAISCGIPIIATAVGGNPEIVSEQNGILLSPSPTPEEIAIALFNLWDNTDLALERRKQSRKFWQDKYNADQNFQSFVDLLKSIRLKKQAT